MTNITHLLKVTAVWISAVYVICYVGVAIYPPVRGLFMRYALHANVPIESGPFSVGNFLAGLLIWNVVALLGVGSFAYLFNAMKK